MFVKEAMTSHAEWVAPDLTPNRGSPPMMRDNKIRLPARWERKTGLVGIITGSRHRPAVPSPTALIRRRQGPRVLMTKGITYCFDDQTLEKPCT